MCLVGNRIDPGHGRLLGGAVGERAGIKPLGARRPERDCLTIRL
jgi:hypothetical protein